MTRIVFACVLLVMLCAPVLAGAQTAASGIPPGPRRVDVSGSAGFLAPTNWGDLVILGTVSPISGVRGQVLSRELDLESASIFDAVVTYWEGRYGFRVHGGFARSCLSIGGACGGGLAAADVGGTSDVDVWTYDIGGSIGLRPYRPGTVIWPYFFFGVGAVTYDLEEPGAPPLSVVDFGDTISPDSPAVIVDGSPEQLIIVLEELKLETKFALTFGIGTDVRIPLRAASVGLRLEVSDRIHESPVDVRVAELGGFRPQDVRLDFGLVHNLRASAGVVIEFGR